MNRLRFRLALRYWLAVDRAVRARESAALRAARFMPAWLVYWCLIRAGSETMTGSEVVPEVPFTTVLARWGERLRPASR